MSIYPVRLAKWFPPGDKNHESMKWAIKYKPCMECGKEDSNWRWVWGHHSLPWGYGDIWCTSRCYRKHRIDAIMKSYDSSKHNGLERMEFRCKLTKGNLEDL